MDNKTIAIIVGVVVVIAIVAGAVFVLNNNNGGGDSDNPIGRNVDIDTTKDTNRMLIFGNANNDNYLDQKDITLIKEIAASGKWDEKKYPLADTNNDRKVTEDDATYLQKILDGKSCTMYYVDWNKQVNKVPYPLTGKVAVPYDSSLWIGQIVGFYDDITYMSRTENFVKNLREDMFPGAAKRIEAQGGTKNYEYDIERLVSADISITLGDTNAMTDNYLDKVKNYKGITPVLLPENREHSGLNWSNSVIMLGAMMNKQANTKEYITYLETVSAEIEKAVEKASTGQQKKSYLLVYCDPEEQDWYVDIRGLGSEQYGDVVNCEKLPLYSSMEPQGDGYIKTSVENIMAMDPDVIIFSCWGPFMQNYTLDQYKALIHERLDYLKETRAYAEEQCYSISYEIYGTLPGIAGLVYLGAQIWPDLFDEDQGYKYVKQYLNKFTAMTTADPEDLVGLLPLVQSEIE